MSAGRVHGHCDGRFKRIQELLEAYIASGDEVGASIAVNIAGESIVDIWGGYMDESRSKDWESDTIVNLFSTSKNVLSLAILILVDRGQLDINEKVSRYWPEFASNGKDAVLVRHLLSHTSGLPGWDHEVDIYDVEKATAQLVEQKPWWVPGTASGYHTVSFGNLLAELIRRVTGETLQSFVQSEISQPLNADFQFGVAEKDLPRVSNVIPPESEPLPVNYDTNNITNKVFGMHSLGPSQANTSAFRSVALGAVNGHGNARSLVRIFSPLTFGSSEVGCSKAMLSNETLDLIFQKQTNGIDDDLVIGVPISWGIEFALVPSSMMSWLPASGRVCFWQGMGGSFVVIDLDRQMTIAYAMNKMASFSEQNSRVESYGKAIYEVLEANCKEPALGG